MNRFDRELVALFGSATIAEARRTDPVSLPLTEELMEAVHEAADALLTMSGQTQAQRRLVAGLPSTTRLTLCMWVMDLGLGPALAEQIFAPTAVTFGRK